MTRNTKRSIERRIEEAEDNPAFAEDLSPKGEVYREVKEAINEEHGEGAANDALIEALRRLGARRWGNDSDAPSELVDDSAFESVDERDRCAATVADVVFSSNESAGSSDDDGGGSASERPPAGRAD